MKKPKRVLCKRTEMFGDKKMLVAGDWYDVVYNKNDTEKTFSIIDNMGTLHLHYMYGTKNDNNHKLPRTYAKWFYTPTELRTMKLERLKGI